MTKPEKRSHALFIVTSIVAVVILAAVLANPPAVKSLRALLQYRLEPNIPSNKTHTLSLKGLSAPVSVHIDPYGIPHIEAKNERDLVLAVGYVQARDRFFQMDVLRRIARGRLSELVGERPFLGASSVAFDRAMRGWGLEKVALHSWATANSKEKEMLKAFCLGVNQALTTFKYPEYNVLGAKPVPFQPVDMYSVGLLNSWSISHNWQQELVRLLLALQLGVADSKAIYPHTPLRKGISLTSYEPKRPTPTSRPSSRPSSQPSPKTTPEKKRTPLRYPLPPAIAPELEKMFHKPTFPTASRKRTHTKPHKRAPKHRKAAFLLRSMQVAAATIMMAGNSNAWVVNGERSASGKPVLANDPHLSHMVPSLFYQQHIKTPDLDAIGVTMPGIPYVLIGHTKQLAWGITSAVADAMDLVIELPHPTHKDQVKNEGKPCFFRKEAITIRVLHNNVFENRTFHIRRTCRGPLLNDMYPHLLPKGTPMVAVQWRLQPVSLDMWSQANRAQNVTQLYKVFNKLVTPVSAVQAADTNGNISLFWAGTVPKRTLRGTFPIPGWKKKYQWQSNLKPSEIPVGRNPEKGYFAHGNNLLVDPSKAKHILQIDSAPPYRVNRIRQLLESSGPHTIESFSAIQRDVKVLRAQLVRPFILADLKRMKLAHPTAKQARNALAKWDLQATPTSNGTAIFFATYRNAIIAAMKDKLSPQAFKFFLSQRYTTNITDGWFAKVDHIVWDNKQTKARETRTQLVQAAFLKAVEQLRANQGDDVKSWRWGKLHSLHFKHPFGGIPLLGSVFSLPRTEGMGALETVWKSHFDLGNPKTPYRTVAGPVLRMLVDLRDVNKARWIIDTGASGWGGSKHFGDQFKKWVKGETIPMLYDWKEIKKQAQGTLTLKP